MGCKRKGSNYIYGQNHLEPNRTRSLIAPDTCETYNVLDIRIIRCILKGKVVVLL